MLGLSMSDRRILCALVHVGSSASVQKLLMFDIPAGLSLDKPAELGEALQAFLREHKVHAGKAAVGVPAKWLLSQDRELPPSTRETAAAMLRLQTERVTVADHAEMVWDYAGEPGETSTRVLLVGILKKRLDQISQLAESAGLSLSGVTSTALATASALKDRNTSALLMLDEFGAEMTSPVLLRHLAGGKGSVASVATEAKRTLAMQGGITNLSLMLWDGTGLSEPELHDLATRSGAKIHRAGSLDAVSAELQPAALNGGAGSLSPASFLPAVALATSGAREILPANFLESKLAIQKPNRFRKPIVYGVGAAVLLVGAAILLFTTVQSRETEAARINSELKVRDPIIKSDKSRIERIGYGRTYFETRPPYLLILRELSQSFNFNEQIWLSSLTIREAKNGVMQGKATDQRLVSQLRDRILANPKFTDVRQTDSRESTGRNREISFTINFTYVGGE
jgi:hypothetical protein